MSKGRCYWITGLSNSGKTTIGTALYYELKREGINTVILDGDLMKQIASGSENAGYETQDRMIRAKRYSLMAKLLADQGVFVIVCAIAMFDSIREWNRKNINGYIEVFLDVPNEVLMKRDKKKILDINNSIQFPKMPDITINNDGSITIRDIVNRIKKIQPINSDDYDRDKAYWNNYYKEFDRDKIVPSDFAKLIGEKLYPGSHILELGCGNGRDSLYFARQGFNVIAIDGSDVAIETLNEVSKEMDNVFFVCDDFVKCHTLYQMIYECIYSRFTLHAITETQENELLANIWEGLSDDGIFCIEARTIHDDIYGKGKKIGHNAYVYNGHYRRFIDVDKFCAKLVSMHYKLLYVEEKRGFSKTDSSDPMLMRCIVKKDLSR